MTHDDLLQSLIPLRVSVQTKNGPLIAPLWFEWDDTRFWCACQRDATLVRALARDPVCAFHLSTNEMPYRGLRGRGRARCLPDVGAVVLERLIDRYLGNRQNALAAWLLSRSATEVALEITPTWQTRWNYSARMSDLRESPGSP